MCPAGRFCGSEGLVQPSGACAAGFLCLMGATVPNPSDNTTGSLCPPGIFCQQGQRAGDGWWWWWMVVFMFVVLWCVMNVKDDILWTKKCFSCVCVLGDCLAGFYCDWGSSRADQALCPAGFFCPSGTPDPVPCPAGAYSSETGNTHQNNCTICTPGYFCQGWKRGFSNIF